ncbi:MAG TPA: DUF2799 domain-containing protein [Bdellovibrionota bacterium]|jgi:hypothetical protein
MHFSKIFLSLVVLALAGCAHGKKDCDKADYYALGEQDGSRGRERDNLREMQEKCGGNQASAEKYEYGYKVGLAKHCDKGLAKKDVDKLEPNKICLREKVPPYMTAYQEELVRKRGELEKEIANLQDKKGKLQAKQDELQSAMGQMDKQKATAE